MLQVCTRSSDNLSVQPMRIKQFLVFDGDRALDLLIAQIPTMLVPGNVNRAKPEQTYHLTAVSWILCGRKCQCSKAACRLF